VLNASKQACYDVNSAIDVPINSCIDVIATGFYRCVSGRSPGSRPS